MKKIITLLLILLTINSVFSLERTTPIDLYLLIDKSISMEESQSFEDMQDWLCNHLLKKCIAMEDFVTVYAFYGESDLIYTQTIHTREDLDNLINTIQVQKADGPFTDIGTALDLVKDRLDNTPSNRMRVTLLCTDLIQEAPYSSAYAGTYYDFADRYLSTDRIIKHPEEKIPGSTVEWYEIAVRTVSDQSVAELAKKIYGNILAAGNTRIYPVQ